MTDTFTVTFRGVRGSIACPGPKTARYGGNTPCVEVRCGGRLIIFDGGTGIRELGDELVAQGQPLDADIFLSHTHIDHIGGLKELMEKTGAKVVVHELELDAVENGNPRLTAASWYGVKYQPVKADRIIKEDSETLTLGNTEVVFLHTPGHTPGSLSRLIHLGSMYPLHVAVHLRISQFLRLAQSIFLL